MESRLPAEQKMLFISDVHLGAFTKEKNDRIERNLIKLIDYAQNHQFRIAILGDLFDYWIEYPGFIPTLGRQLLQRFEQFHQDGKSSLYITGNHDNWTLGHFTERGFDVEPDYRFLNIDNLRVAVLHGDAIGEDLSSLKRPFLHRLLRNATFLKLYRSVLPPAAGLRLMRIVSKLSRIAGLKTNKTSKLDRWAKRMLENSNIDYILCGHDHQPRCKKYRFGTYINLGNFCLDHTLVTYNNGSFKLVQWNGSNNELIHLNTQQKPHE